MLVFLLLLFKALRLVDITSSYRCCFPAPRRCLLDTKRRLAKSSSSFSSNALLLDSFVFDPLPFVLRFPPLTFFAGGRAHNSRRSVPNALSVAKVEAPPPPPPPPPEDDAPAFDDDTPPAGKPPEDTDSDPRFSPCPALLRRPRAVVVGGATVVVVIFSF